MALVPCKECGTLNSLEAEICLSCEYPVKGRPKTNWLKGLALLLALILVIPLALYALQTVSTQTNEPSLPSPKWSRARLQCYRRSIAQISRYYSSVSPNGARGCVFAKRTIFVGDHIRGSLELVYLCYNALTTILAILSTTSMNSNNIIKVKRPTKLQAPPPPLNDSAIEEAVEAFQQSAIETLKQPEPVVNEEIFMGTPRDESVYGCGWSLTELLNEFNER